MGARVRMYRNGMTGCVVSCGNQTPPKRGACGGWNSATVRRNTAWLYSIDRDRLDGLGVSFTTSVRLCPPAHGDWAALRRKFVKRLERLGLVRLHWVTEWQRRGVPHLHGAAYFPDSCDPRELEARMLSAWMDVATKAGLHPGLRGQHFRAMWDVGGWHQYVSKHAARGARHYQRCPENIPAGWRGVTGRMWGYTGEWPTTDPAEVEMTNPAFWAMRRLVRRLRIAQARAACDPRRIRQARRMLQHSDPALCRVCGWSEWIPEKTTGLLLAAVAGQGHQLYG